MSKEATNLKDLQPAGVHHQMTLANLQKLLLIVGKEVKLMDIGTPREYRIVNKRLCPGVYEVWLEEKVEIVIRTRGKGFRI